MVIPQSFRRFLVAKDMFPRIFKELSKELKRHVPECPNFSDVEISFVLIILLRENVFPVNSSGSSDSLPEFTPRDSVSLQTFILKYRQQIILFYTNRRMRIAK